MGKHGLTPEEEQRRFELDRARREAEVREWYRKRALQKELEEEQKAYFLGRQIERTKAEIAEKKEYLFRKKFVRFPNRGEKKEMIVNMILNLRAEKKTLEQIGEALQVTGERVRQIVAALSPEERWYFAMHSPIGKGMNRKDPNKFYCQRCAKEFFSRNNNAKFCSVACGFDSLTKYKKAPRRMGSYERYLWLYRNDPKYRKVHAKRMHEQYLRKKKDPEWVAKNKEKQKIWMRRYHEKKKYGYCITPLP